MRKLISSVFAGRRALMFAPVLASGALAFASPASATVVYDNVPSPQPGNLPSLGYEANQTAEFGGQVELVGTQRQNPKITVAMSSWGCESGQWFDGSCSTTPGASFEHSITL